MLLAVSFFPFRMAILPVIDLLDRMAREILRENYLSNYFYIVAQSDNWLLTTFINKTEKLLEDSALP